MIANPSDRDPRCDAGTALHTVAASAVTAIDAVLPPAFEDRMLGNDIAQVDDADQVWQLLDLDDTTGAIGYAVVVAPDRDEAVVADAALQLEHGIEAMLGQRLQLRLLGGKRLGCVVPWVRTLATVSSQSVS